jgi:hypothetical protein
MIYIHTLVDDSLYLRFWEVVRARSFNLNTEEKLQLGRIVW